MSFGIFEAAVSSEAEAGIAKQAAKDSFDAAVYDVRAKLGPSLFQASSVDEFRDRVAMMKRDQSVFKIIGQHLMPVTGVVRRIVGERGILEKEFRRTLMACGGACEGSKEKCEACKAREARLVRGGPQGPMPETGGENIDDWEHWGTGGHVIDPSSAEAGLMHAGGRYRQAGEHDVEWFNHTQVNPYSGRSGPDVTPKGRSPGPAGEFWGEEDEPYWKPPKSKGRHRQADFDNGTVNVKSTFSPSEGELHPEGNWDGYLNSVDQGAEGKVDRNFESRRYAQSGDAWGMDAPDKTSGMAGPTAPGSSPARGSVNPAPGSVPAGPGTPLGPQPPMTPGGAPTPGGAVPPVSPGLGPTSPGTRAGSVDYAVYHDWCEANGRSPARLSSLDVYAANLPDDRYMRLAAIITSVGVGVPGQTRPKPVQSPSVTPAVKPAPTKLPATNVQRGVTQKWPDQANVQNWNRRVTQACNDTDWEGQHMPKTPSTKLKKKDKVSGRRGMMGDPFEPGGKRTGPIPTSWRKDPDQRLPKGVPSTRLKKKDKVAGAHTDYMAEDNPQWDKFVERSTVKRPAELEKNGIEQLRVKRKLNSSRQDPMRAYVAWCRANNLTKLSARNIAYFAGNDAGLAYHLAYRARQAIRVARRRYAGEHSIENYPRDEPRFRSEGHPRRYMDPTVMGPDDQDSYAQAVTDPSGARGYPSLPKHRAPQHRSGGRYAGQHDIEMGVGRTRYRNQRNPYTGDYPSGYNEQVRQRDWNGGPTQEGYWPEPERPGKHRASSYRYAQPDYLQKADDALSQLLNQKAEEFQETIAPLQQALVTVQQAEQIQQQQNPMNVLPPPGTVNVMPGGDQGPAGMPAPGAEDLGASAQALAGPLGGGGGGEMGADQGAPGGGPPPAAGPGGGMPPEMQMAANRRRGGRGKGRGAMRPRQGASNDPRPGEGPEEWARRNNYDLGHQDTKTEWHRLKGDPEPRGGYEAYPGPKRRQGANVNELWEKFQATPGNTLRGSDDDYRAFQERFKVGPQALQRLKRQHSTTVGRRGRRKPAGRHGPTERSHEDVYQDWAARHGHDPDDWATFFEQMYTPGRHERESRRRRRLAARRRRASEPTFGEKLNAIAEQFHPYTWDVHEQHNGPQWALNTLQTHIDKADEHYGPGAISPEQKAALQQLHSDYRQKHFPQGRQGMRKQAWSGWGPAQFPKTRQVPGWDWDKHLLAYTAARPQHFACDCGEAFSTPGGFRVCGGCGKQWNSYVIGTGGTNRNASADKFLVREIPARKEGDVIVASRRTAGISEILEKHRGNRPVNAIEAQDADSDWHLDRGNTSAAWTLHKEKQLGRPMSQWSQDDWAIAGEPPKRKASRRPNFRMALPQIRQPLGSMRKQAPFGGYKDFDACTDANSDKRSPDAYCGYIKHKVEGGKHEGPPGTFRDYDWMHNPVKPPKLDRRQNGTPVMRTTPNTGPGYPDAYGADEWNEGGYFTTPPKKHRRGRATRRRAEAEDMGLNRFRQGPEYGNQKGRPVNPKAFKQEYNPHVEYTDEPDYPEMRGDPMNPDRGGPEYEKKMREYGPSAKGIRDLYKGKHPPGAYPHGGFWGPSGPAEARWPGHAPGQMDPHFDWYHDWSQEYVPDRRAVDFRPGSPRLSGRHRLTGPKHQPSKSRPSVEDAPRRAYPSHQEPPPYVTLVDRTGALHNLIDPGEIGEGQDTGIPTMGQMGRDWARRGDGGRYVMGPAPR